MPKSQNGWPANDISLTKSWTIPELRASCAWRAAMPASC